MDKKPLFLVHEYTVARRGYMLVFEVKDDGLSMELF
jgi:hypothetical protein